jgi:hypothetical protein
MPRDRDPLNREERRHAERLGEGGVLPSERPQSSQHDIASRGGQDEQSVRAKGSGHRKKTADKWNQ